ncbi:MAG TPA: BON domain-containing protein [Terriglobales bacterium]|nr:BON domain-containing protein [Terriglobales bacterium]
MKAKACFLYAVFIFTLAAGVGCSKAPNDAQIASDIQAKINADSGLQGKQLGVQAANGSVTLSGTVDNDTQRDAAARYAASEAGVKQVVNNLQITPPAPVQTAQAPPAAPEKPKPSPVKHRGQAPKTEDDAPPPVSDDSTQVASAAPAPAPVSTVVIPPPAPQPATPPPPPPPQKVTVPYGTALSVRLVDPIDSEKNQLGDVFHATMNAPIVQDGSVVIPSGSDVQGHLVDVKSAGKFAGKSVVVLQLDSISSGGQTYNIQTDQYSRDGSSRGKNTAEKVGAGAGIGAIIGALAGGGKGAAIGAAAGGGLGGGVQAAGKGQQIKLPSETVLNFTLQAPVTVLATSQGPDSGRQKLGPNN